MAKKAIVGEKVGMTQVWVDDRVVPVTVIRVAACRVVQLKTPETDGYSAVQVTLGTQKPQPAPPGRGRLVTRDRGVEVVQMAWSEPTL